MASRYYDPIGVAMDNAKERARQKVRDLTAPDLVAGPPSVTGYAYRYRSNRGGGSIVGRHSLSDDEFDAAVADYYDYNNMWTPTMIGLPPPQAPVVPPPAPIPAVQPVTPQIGKTVPKPTQGVPQVVVNKTKRIRQAIARGYSGGGSRSGTGTAGSGRSYGGGYVGGTYQGFGGSQINQGIGQAFRNR